MIEPMAALLCSSDPTQVLQGLELVASMDSAAVEEEVLGGTVLVGLPKAAYESIDGETRSRIRCCTLDGPLSSDGFFAHIAALILLVRHVRRCPDARAPSPGHRRIQLLANPAGWYFATRDLELSSGSLVYQESSTSFPSAAALLDWARSEPDWLPKTIASRAVLVERYGQVLLRELPTLHRSIPSPLRESLFSELAALCDGGHLCLTGLPLDALPGWVDLSRLASLDITGTRIRSLSGNLTGITLTLDADQWAEWTGPLEVDALKLEGLGDQVDLRRLPALRLLSLSFCARMPADLFKRLPHVESLELMVSVEQSVPDAVWARPLRHLSLGGFFSVVLEGEPPPTLETLTIAEDCLKGAEAGWGGVLRLSMLHEVWMLEYSSIIRTIKAVRDLTGLGLRDAKVLVESAPCLILRAETNREARRVQRLLAESGAHVVLR